VTDGPYSSDPDFSTAADRDSYYPSTKPNVYVASDGIKGRGPILDVADFVDPQKPYATSFDQGGGNYQREKNNSGLGGFSGPLPRSNNHPKKGTGV